MPDFDEEAILKRARDQWTVVDSDSLETEPDLVRIGMVTARTHVALVRPRQPDELDVPVLHTDVLTNLLGIDEEQVREQKYITYVRGAKAAIAEVREKGAQVAFLLNPTPIEDMARIAFAGGVMPQKSTDFYPKLLTGMTIYRL